MTNRELIKSFVNGAEKGKGSNLYIDGEDLINYSTVIATRVGDIVVLNNHRYSSTTSKNQTYVRYEANKMIECGEGRFTVLNREADKMKEVIDAFKSMSGVTCMEIR